MPKNRKRANQKGAKSISIRTKHKIGGRKSGRGVKHLATEELIVLAKKHPRDKNKIISELNRRNPFGLNSQITDIIGVA